MARRNKYHAIRVETVDGKFDSKSEFSRWCWLRQEEKAGRIADLKRQVEYSLDVNGMHICKYVADFVITLPDGRVVVDDYKGMMTDTFRLKAKLMKACHGIEINVAKTPTAEYG